MREGLTEARSDNVINRPDIQKQACRCCCNCILAIRGKPYLSFKPHSSLDRGRAVYHSYRFPEYGRSHNVKFLVCHSAQSLSLDAVIISASPLLRCAADSACTRAHSSCLNGTTSSSFSVDEKYSPAIVCTDSGDNAMPGRVTVSCGSGLKNSHAYVRFIRRTIMR